MHRSIDPAALEPADRHKLSIGTVVPRPIAWITSQDESGRVNLAPFSYFMGCHSYLPAIAVSIGSRKDGTPKDTRANIARSGELVVNVVSEALGETMNASAAAFPSELGEIEALGIDTLPSEVVGPPRVAASPIQIECGLMHSIDLGEAPRVSTLFIARVLRYHVREDLLLEGYKIDQAGIEAIGRMGGRSYTRARDPFDMIIPSWQDALPEAGGPDGGAPPRG